VASLALRSRSSQDLWAVLPSVFWAAMLAGRSGAPLLLKRRHPRAVVIAGLACASAGTALLLANSGVVTTLAAGVLCGLGMAPVFPLVVAEYADRAGRAPVSGLLFSAAGLGGAAIPALVGYLSQATGSLRLGMSTLLVFLAVMLALRVAPSRS
jgi:fucose permease